MRVGDWRGGSMNRHHSYKYNDTNTCLIKMKRDTPVKAEAVRFVCLGCTHGEFPRELPTGMVIHYLYLYM